MVKYNEELDITFAALSDPTRRAILERLTEKEFSVSELAAPFDMSLVAVSKHLKVLERSGLIRRSREGRVHRLGLEARPLSKACEWLEDYRIFWEGALDLLAEHLKRDKEDHSDNQEKPKENP